MPLYILNDRLWFPPADNALEDGLLAMGGDLSTERLLLAYRKGIFPWYDGDIPLWWCPHPRFVLFPQNLKISTSMKALLKKNAFDFTINKAFSQVIHLCKEIKREGQDGTWINNAVEDAYIKLYKLGFAHSAEVWQKDTLIGGLYGIRMGKIFFGESMFSLVSNASKYAFIKYIHHLQHEELKLIDCQVYTSHLESLGAEMIERNRFLVLLKKYIY